MNLLSLNITGCQFLLGKIPIAALFLFPFPSISKERASNIMSNIPRVYTLGNSPLANYFAYAISKISSQPQIPNVVLLLSDQKKLDRFLEQDSTLTLLDDNSTDRSNSMQFMAACSPPTYANGDPAIIDNLILAEQSKKHFTSLLDFYSRSLRDTTNLLFLNPPMGALEYMYDKIWSEPR